MSRRNDSPLGYLPSTTHQGYRDANSSLLFGNREFIVDHPSMSHRRYNNGNLSPSTGNRQLGLDSQPFFQDNRRIVVPTEHRPLDERIAMRPFGPPSIPLDPYSRTRVIIVNSNMGRGVSSMLPQLPDRPTPISSRQVNVRPSTEADESKLTKEEQEIVLKKLKKEIYNPTAKTLARRVSLYYRDLNDELNNKTVTKHKDEEGKSCAVCLEDFDRNEEVILTPCNHMFHEECIVPWVKNQGRCPVCRFALCERMKEDVSTLNNNNNSNRGATQPANHELFTNELISLIQAVDEAFTWGV